MESSRTTLQDEITTNLVAKIEDNEQEMCGYKFFHVNPCQKNDYN
jgi:hypothetical protein